MSSSMARAKAQNLPMLIVESGHEIFLEGNAGSSSLSPPSSLLPKRGAQRDSMCARPLGVVENASHINDFVKSHTDFSQSAGRR